MKRFYVLLFILLLSILLAFYIENAEAKEITINGIRNEMTTDGEGFINSTCYIKEAVLTEVQKGICTSYNERTSHSNYQFKTLDGEVDILFTKEIIGVENSDRSIGEKRDYRTYILDQIHTLRLNIIELEKELNFN